MTRWALFLGAAALSFSVLLPRVGASSTVRTTNGNACGMLPVGDGSVAGVCPVTAGSDFYTGNLTTMYFDYTLLAQRSPQLTFYKVSYTGGFAHADSVTKTNQPAGTYDVAVTANNVKQVPSIYDYVGADIAFVDSVIGVAIVSQ